jgi:hypothetical protein
MFINFSEFFFQKIIFPNFIFSRSLSRYVLFLGKSVGYKKRQLIYKKGVIILHLKSFVLLKKGHCSFFMLYFLSIFNSNTKNAVNIVKYSFFIITIKIKSKPKEAKKKPKVSQKKPKRSHITYNYLLPFM